MSLSLGQILTDAEVGMEVLGEIQMDEAAIQAGQTATASAPLSLYGHAGNISVTWTPG
jgi:hypothetical protein